MRPYQFQTADKIAAGCHTLERLNEYLNVLPPVRTALVLSQPSIVKAGYAESVVRQLEQSGIACQLNADVRPEPTDQAIIAIFEKYKDEGFDMVVGIGGGSVLDAAKILSVLATNAMTIEEMLGIDKIAAAGVPLILIPTTSGTGSEVTPNAIVTLPEQELKIGIVSRYLLPQLVIIDPLLTLGLPKPITAATGMDAFTHAFESFISNKANPFSDMFALESMRLISQSIETAYHHGDQADAREAMMLGSMYGGMALTCAGTAAVHAMAYPIGGKFNIPHGVANSMLLPHVLAFNLDAIAHRMNLAASAMGITDSHRCSSGEAADRVLERITKWTSALDIPQDLRSFGVTDRDVPDLAIAASKVTRLMDNNPKHMTVDDIESIYRQLIS
ncbi:alcohol dehydrogenase [Paenibacillus sp. MY03]|uniref:iron-containing alcohol dehydrogenase n=1 Tax=Paenibacillus sp. MY03 TaxID=302980 RepID=UPI000B3D4DF6|nr:iron-containing alcohol dehydrogenase [Paenibacillus sp. MY03]OUS76677.1 alcohol dehydrogenase [Paenibacillus sp. MY03]